MNGARPELIFVAGPQAGERAVLMSNVALVGRSPAADVRLAEGAASREQVRFQLTGQGWLMQNLSTNGTIVNGKRYKGLKQLILETGDVLGVGLETEVLYVSPGDDPEEALAAYRDKHGVAEIRPTARPSPPPAEPAEKDKPRPGAKADARADQAPRKGWKRAEEEEAEDEDKADAEEGPGSSKLKYVLFAIVLVSLLFFGVAIIKKAMSTDDGPSGPEGPPRLTDKEIRASLTAPLERSPSPVKAGEALDRAVRSYANRNLWETGDLYRCVKDFMLHQAYRNSQAFQSVDHERMAEQASGELIDLVLSKYDAAWKFEKARSYRNAMAAFQELMFILPIAELEQEGPIYRVIIQNVLQHRNFIKKHMGKVRQW